MSRLLGSVRRPWMVALFAVLAAVIAIVSQSAQPSQAVQAPTLVSAPTIAGPGGVFSIAQGKTVTVTAGSWTDSPTLTYQWYRCTSQIVATATDPTNCQIITGDTGTTHRNSVSDVGFFITVKETATNAMGSSSYYSDATTRVRQSNTVATYAGGMCVIRIGRLYCAGAGGTTVGYGINYGIVGNGKMGLLQSSWVGPQTTMSGKILTDVIDVEGSRSVVCALTLTGSIYCLGGSGVNSLPDGLGIFTHYYFTQILSSAGVPVTGATTLTVMDNGLCFGKANGSLYCSGKNPVGQVGNGTVATDAVYPTQVLTAVSTPLTGVIQVHGGASYAASPLSTVCAITTDGTTVGGKLYCWGDNAKYQLGDGTTTNRSYAASLTANSSSVGFSYVSTSSDHTCAIQNTGVLCWGQSTNGGTGGAGANITTPTQPVNTAGGVSFASGYVQAETNETAADASCFVNISGAVFCTGYSLNSSIDIAASTTTPKPTVDWTSGITQIKMGKNYTCAVNGSAVTISCMGDNTAGQFGTGSTWTLSASPITLTALTGNLGVSNTVGDSASPAITGNNNIGDVLTDSSIWTGFPFPTLSYQWYQCASAVTVGSSVPSGCTAISGATSSTYTVQAGDLGYFITDFVTSSNDAGISTKVIPQSNAIGQLPGAVTYPTVSVPTSATDPILGTVFTQVPGTWNGANPVGTTSSRWYRCGNSGSEVASTVIPADCSLIYGATGNTYKATQSEMGFYVRAGQAYTSTAGTIVALSATSAQVRPSNFVSGDYGPDCSMRYGRLYCTGQVTNGQLGDLTTATASFNDTPTPVVNADGTPMTDVVQFAVTQTAMCAIKVDHSMWCWGSASFGVLGNGVTTGMVRPTRVPGTTQWAQVAMSGSTTCAIDTSGSLWCTGDGGTYGFGDGTANVSTFRKTTSANLMSGVIQISGSSNMPNYCVLKKDGSVWCWGAGTGQIGDGNPVTRTTAINPVGLESGVTNISLSSNSACAVKNGGLWCWGANTGNQLGLYTANVNINYPPVQMPVGAGGADPTIGITAVFGSRNATYSYDHFCATNYLGSLMCVGVNSNYELNLAINAVQTSMTQTRFTSGVSDAGSNSINVGQASCFVVNNATMCAGGNSMGQLGTGNFSTYQAGTGPVASKNLTNGVGILDLAPSSLAVSTSQNYAPGQTVSTTVSSESSPAATSAYQWYTCSQPGITGTTVPADCSAISGQTSTTYAVQNADAGNYIRVAVTQTNIIGTSTVVSAASLVGTAPVASIVPSGTIQTPLKLLTGTTLSGPGIPIFTGSPSPTTTVQWYHCYTTSNTWTTVLPSGCYAADGGNTAGYIVNHADDGFFMMVGYSASSSAGTVSYFSPTTSRVIFANKIAMTGTGAACVIKSSRVYCWGYQVTGGTLGQSKVYYNNGLVDGTATAGSMRTFPTTPIQLANGSPLSDVISISAGLNHVCAVTYSGSLYCWGSNAYGQLGDGTTTTRTVATPVLSAANTPVTGVTQVAASDGNTCAIISGGLTCWGQVGILATAKSYATGMVTNLSSGVQQVVAGDTHICAILDAAAKCFGSGAGQALGDATTTSTYNPPTTPLQSRYNGQVIQLNNGVTAISAGYQGACAVKVGKLYCWGSTASYNLGTTPMGAPFLPVGTAADGVTRFDSNVIGVNQGTSYNSGTVQGGCAIKVGGAVYCVGSVDRGAGSGTAASTIQTPTLATNLTSGVTEMAIGGWETCAIKSNNIWCAGTDGSGAGNTGSNLFLDGLQLPSLTHKQLPISGANLGASESAPTAGTATISGFTAVGNTLTSVNSSFENSGAWQGLPVPAMTNQWYLCDSSGAATSSVPSDCTAIANGATSTIAISADQVGKYFRTAITATNTLGSATVISAAYGPVGDPPAVTRAATLNSPNSPVLNSTTSISGNSAQFGGTSQTITKTYQWYRCSSTDSNTATSTPSGCVAIPGATSSTFALGRTEIGGYLRLASIGTSPAGQVTSYSATSDMVVEGAQVATGDDVTCAIKLGRVYCWGTNTYFELGTGDTVTTTTVTTAAAATPVKKNASTILENVVDVQAFGTVVCAIDTSGALYCWGSNANGLLGSGAATTTKTAYAQTPSAAADGATFDSGVVGIQISQYVACAWKRTGTGYCWGVNTTGQLGSSNFTVSSSVYSLIPSAVSTLTSIRAMTVGSTAVCAISSGALYCWGQNTNYLVTEGTSAATYQTTPLARSGLTADLMAVSLTSQTGCVVKNYGVSCFGSNANGALGLGMAVTTTTSAGTGAYAQTGDTATGVSGVYSNKNGTTFCATKFDGTLYCWGNATDGSLPGLVIPPTPNTFYTTPTLSSVTGVSYLAYKNGTISNICLVTTTGIKCDGTGTAYQMGNGSAANIIGTSSAAPAMYSPPTFASLLGADYVAPVWTTAPTMSGSLVSVGASLSTTTPTAYGFPTPVIAGKWSDCTGTGNATNSVPNDCTDIANANASTYTIQSSDFGYKIRAAFTATNSFATAYAYTATTTSSVGTLSQTNFARPLGGGSVLQVGDTLTQAKANWNGNPAPSITMGWLRCGNDNQTTQVVVTTLAALVPDCVTISGATGNSYTITQADIGSFIRATQIATSAVGSVQAVSPASNFVISNYLPKVAMTSNTTCVITGGMVDCAGVQSGGNLGNNSSSTSVTTPVRVLKSATAGDYLTGILAIFAGSTQDDFCAISSSAELWCWGPSTSVNLLSATSTADQKFAVRPLGTMKVANVTIGGAAFICAVTQGDVNNPGGALYCWGFNTNYNLGDGTTAAKYLPSKVLTIASGVSQVSAGNQDVCAVVNAGLKCWGAWANGSFALPNVGISQSTPYSVTGLTTGVSRVSTGGGTGCVIKDGGVYCWSNKNNYGSMGNNTTTNSATPTQVVAATDGVSLSSGISDIYVGRDTALTPTDTVCAVRATTGALYCWGYGGRYNLMDGTTTNAQSKPKLSSLTSGVSNVVMGWGAYGTCAIKSSTLYCAGASNTYAVFMNGVTSTAQPNPTAVNAYNSPNYVAAASLPAITLPNSPTVGVALNPDLGSATGVESSTQSFSWYSCATSHIGNTSLPSDCQLATGSTVNSSSYVPVTADKNTYLLLKVVTTNSAGSTTAYSDTTNAVGIGSQTVTITGGDSAPLPGSTVQLSATASSGLTTFNWGSNTPLVCTVDSTGLVSAIGGGRCEITATQPGNGDFSASTATQVMTLARATQTISWTPPSTIDYGSETTLAAIASSGGTITYASTTPDTCSVAGGKVTGLALGTCTLTADQAGSAGFFPATQVTVSTTVVRGAQTITFSNAVIELPNGTYQLTATTTSGLPLTYSSSSASSICSVNGSTLTMNAVGSCVVTASQAGSTNYFAATDVSATFRIVSSPTPDVAVTITGTPRNGTSYGSTPGVWVGAGTVNISYQWYSCTSNGNALASVGDFADVVPSDCSAISGANASTFTPTSAEVGTNLRLAERASNTIGGTTNYYTAFTAPSAAVLKKTQTITFGALANATYGDSAITLAATSDRALTISYSSSNAAICSISGSTLTILGAGSCDVTASQSGDSGIAAAASVTQTLTIAKASQVVTLPAFSGATYGDSAIASGASSTSGLTVSLTSNSTSVCTISGLSVAIVGTGTCSVTASQPGDSNYLAAANVIKTFSVVKAAQTITFTGSVKQKSAGTFTAGGIASSGLTVTYTSQTPLVCSVASGTVTPITLGTCTLTASQAGDANYNAASNVNASFTIEAVPTQTTSSAIAAQANYRFGTAITTTAGTWAGTPTISISNSWFRCDTAETYVAQTGSASDLMPSDCVSISGATSTSYTPVAEDIGKFVAFAETATNTTSLGTNIRTTLLSTATAVEKQTQTLTFAAFTAVTYGVSPVTLSASSNRSLTVSFVSSDTTTCSIAGNTLTVLKAGTCDVTASQAGDANTLAATSVVRTLTINKAAQTITFAPTTKQKPAGDFAAGGSASSGLTVSYSSSTTSVCTVSGSTVSPVGLGTCTIVASQAGDSNYNAATSVTASFTIESVPVQTTAISIASAANYRFGTAITTTAGAWTGTATVAISRAWYRCDTAPSISAGTGSAASLAPADCALISGAVGTSYTPVAADITKFVAVAETASNTTSTGANTRTTFVSTATAVEKQTQTITFAALSNATYGDAAISLTASSDRSLTITYASSNTAVCTVSGSTLTVVAPGTCDVTASQAGDATTLAATSVTRTLTVVKANQTITMPNFTAGVYGGAAKASGASASSGLTVTLTAADTSVCTVTSLNVNIVAPGTCSITASQAGNANYNAAADVTKSFTISKASQTITFAPTTKQKPAGDFAAGGSATSGLTVTYVSTTTSVCTVSGSTVSPVGLGTCTITASQAGDSNWSAAADVTASFTIESVPVQTAAEAIASAANYRFGVPVTVTAGTWTGTAAVTVTRAWFRCDTAPSISVGTGTATSLKPADCTAITGATNTSYTPAAADITKYLAVAETATNTTSAGTNNRTTFVSTATAVEKQTQTITFGALASATYGDAAISLTASSDRSLTITYTSSNTAVCTVSGATLTVVAAGTCDVTASQAGDATTLAATSVTQTLTVNKKAQTINLPAFTAGVYGGAAKASGASATSGLTVTLTSNDTSICTVTGLSVNQLIPGTCSITATQAGDSNYLAAPSVTKTFTIAKASQTITFAPTTKQKPAGDFAAGGTASSGLTVTYVSTTTSVCTVSGSTVSPVGLGTCTITASQAGDSNWSAAADVTASFTIESVPVQSTSEVIASAANYRFGVPVTVTAGTWAGTSVITVSRAWYRCDSSAAVSAGTGSAAALAPAGCTAISGATGTSYTPVAADITKYLAVAETASNTTSTGSNLRTTFVSTATAVEKQTQTITFAALANATYGDPAISLTASSDRSLTITYASSNTAVCTVAGSTLTVVAPGTCDVTASQAGDANTLAATSVTRTLTVVKANQTVSLNNLAAIDFRGTPTVLVYSATSGLPVTVASNSTSVCTVSGTTVSVVAVGTCSITASQAGNSNYNAATSVTKTFVISKAQDTLTFTGATKQFRSGNFTISASTLSGASVSFTSTTTSICTVSGTTVTPVTHGACVITATAATDSNYLAPANVNATFTIERAVEQTAVHSLTPYSTYWYDQRIDYTAGTWVGSGTVSVSHNWYVCTSRPTTNVVSGSAVPAGCSLVNETSTGSYRPVAADIGKYVVLAETASNVTAGVTNTSTSWISASGVVTKWTQNLTFGALADKTYGDIPFTLNGISDQGQPVTYTSSNTSVCTVSGSVVSIVAAGSCDITASQPGNTTIAAATPITQTLTVNKAAQTVSLGSFSDVTYSPATVTAIASATSGLSTALVSSDTSVCTISGTTISLVKAGTCSITASQAGNNNYSAAVSVTKSFAIAKASQTITFDLPSFISTGEHNGHTLDATTDSGLAITYSVNNTAVCDIQNGNVVPVGVGTCVVTATQAGDDRFLSASVSDTVIIADYPFVDSLVPTDSAYTSSTSTSFTVTFNGAITGFTSADLVTVPAGACTIGEPASVNGSAAVYTVALTNCAEGAVKLKVLAGSISNGAPGPVEDSIGDAVNVDFTFAQGVTIAPQFTTPTNRTSLVYNVTFSEDVTGFTPADVTFTGTGSANCAATVTGSGSSYVLTVTGCTDGNVSLSVASNSVADLAGNIGPSTATTSASATVDLIAPDAFDVTGLPESYSRATDFTVEFPTVAGNTYHCTLNGVELQGCDGSLVIPASSLTPGDYTVEVWATDAAGNESTHFSRSFSIGNYARPAAPVINVAAFDRTAYNHLTINWGVAIGQSTQLPVTGIKLEYSTDGTTWTAVPTLAADATSYDLAIRSGQNYRFRVRALSGPFEANASDLSAVATYVATYRPAIVSMSTSAALQKPAAGTVITLTGVDFRDFAEPTPASMAGTTVTITDNAGKPTIAQLVSVTATTIRFNVPATTKLGVATIKVTVGAGTFQRTSATRNLNIVAAKVNQVITMAVPVGAQIGSPDIQLNAALDSLNVPTFVIQPGSIGICSVSTTGLLHAIKGGNCSFTVTAPASDAFNAFTSTAYTVPVIRMNVDVTFALPQDLIAAFNSNNELPIGPATYQLAATPDANILNTVVKISSTPETTCFVDADKVLHIVGTGPCSITALAENDYYRTSVPVVRTFNIARNNQTLTYVAPGTSLGLISAAEATDSPSGFQLQATLSSGLTPVFESANSDICSVDTTGVVTWSGDLVKNPTAVCAIKISHPGDSNFNPIPDMNITFTARHVPPLAPVGGWIHEPDGSLAVGRTGGLAANGADGVAVVVVTGNKITITPFSRGLYIGPITAKITIPYYVPVKNILTLKTQVCTVKFGITKKFKPGDPNAFKQKAFPNKLACAANKDAIAYFAQGNRLLPTLEIKRDRRWPTTYLAKTGGDGKGKPIYPAIKTWHLTIG